MKNQTVFLGQILLLVCIIWALVFAPAPVTATNLGEKASHGSFLNPETINLLGTYPVGSAPRGLAFDGTNIWVANTGSGNVTKLKASDGALVGTYPAGLDP